MAIISEAILPFGRGDRSGIPWDPPTDLTEVIEGIASAS